MRMDARITWKQIPLLTKMQVGAHNAVAGLDFLMFKVRIFPNQCHKVKITLNAMDTYDIELIKIRKGQAQQVKSLSDIYCDQLGEVIYNLCTVR
jgi:hypothetical protein